MSNDNPTDTGIPARPKLGCAAQLALLVVLLVPAVAVVGQPGIPGSLGVKAVVVALFVLVEWGAVDRLSPPYRRWVDLARAFPDAQTGISALPQRTWAARLVGLWPVGLGVALVAPVSHGHNLAAAAFFVLLIAFLPYRVMFVVAIARRAQAVVSRAYPGDEVIAVKSSASRPAIALLVTPDAFGVMSTNGPTRQVRLVPWSDVASVTEGRLGGNSSIRIEIRDADRIEAVPAVGTWWNILFWPEAVTPRLVEHIEAVRRAAFERGPADIRD